MLDEADQKIISILRENARMSVRKIASQLKLSPATVSKRIAKLEREGIIKKYTAIVEDEEIEANCSLMLMISISRETDPDDFGRRLSKLPEICICMRVTGHYEIFALANCRDSSKVSDLLNKIRELGKINEVNTALVIKKYKISSASYEVVQG